MLSHLSANMRQNQVPIVEFHSEHRVWEGLDNLALNLNTFFFRHS